MKTGGQERGKVEKIGNGLKLATHKKRNPEGKDTWEDDTTLLIR